jgi:glycine cleavage system H protein
VDAPELVNDDPFDAGWLVRVALSNPGELDNLMSADDYDSYTAGL